MTPLFDEIKIGYQFPTIEHEITQQVIDRAALAHLDFNPVHTNIEWSARAQVFGTDKTVAHGMFTMSLMASAVLRHWDVIGRIRKMEAKLTKPLPVGQRVTARAEVTELHPRHSGGLVLIGLTVTDASGDVAGVGNYTIEL